MTKQGTIREFLIKEYELVYQRHVRVHDVIQSIVKYYFTVMAGITGALLYVTYKENLFELGGNDLRHIVLLALSLAQILFSILVVFIYISAWAGRDYLRDKQGVLLKILLTNGDGDISEDGVQEYKQVKKFQSDMLKGMTFLKWYLLVCYLGVWFSATVVWGVVVKAQVYVSALAGLLFVLALHAGVHLYIRVRKSNELRKAKLEAA